MTVTVTAMAAAAPCIFGYHSRPSLLPTLAQVLQRRGAHGTVGHAHTYDVAIVRKPCGPVFVFEMDTNRAICGGSMLAAGAPVSDTTCENSGPGSGAYRRIDGAGSFL